MMAAEEAIMSGFSGNLSGGTHHSFHSHGEGFCVFNDFAITANDLIIKKGLHDILILDLDVHHGNGNAELLSHMPEVFIVSFHGEHNYPFSKPASDLDIAFPNFTEDDFYLDKLQQVLEKLSLRKWDIILYQAGVDPLKEDHLGKLSLSLEGLYKRDRLVFEFAKSLDTPIAVGLGGGYAKPIELTVEAHLNTYRAASTVFHQ